MLVHRIPSSQTILDPLNGLIISFGGGTEDFHLCSMLDSSRRPRGSKAYEDEVASICLKDDYLPT